MLLQVQAIEVFDDNWLEWGGLQAAVAEAVGAVTPATNGGAPNGGRKIDVAATVGGMRQLRTSLNRLPVSQLSILRDECDTMQRAIAALGKVPPATR